MLRTSESGTVVCVCVYKKGNFRLLWLDLLGSPPCPVDYGFDFIMLSDDASFPLVPFIFISRFLPPRDYWPEIRELPEN